MVTIATPFSELLLCVQTTASELLDIVDTGDNVVGKATRGEIHQFSLMHRSIHVLVFDGAGRVLLQKRSVQKDQCAGMWDTSCAGHVESGQTYEETVPRELQEELGVTPTDSLKTLFKMMPTTDNGYEFAMVYTIDCTGPFTVAEDEIDEVQWFSVEYVDAWSDRILRVVGSKDSQDLTSGFIEIWRRYRNKSQGDA